MSGPHPIRLAWSHVSEIGMRASNEDSLGHATQGALDCFIEHEFVEIDAQKCAFDGARGRRQWLQEQSRVVPIFAQVQRR